MPPVTFQSTLIRYLPAAFFICLLAIGFFLFNDYGVSWDEPVQRDLGNANWNYVLKGDTTWFHGFNQYYGPFVEMIETAPERIFHFTDLKVVYLSRHLINYFLFWLGTIFLYLLGMELFDSTGFALLGVVMLCLTPRIFAQSFYNSKDLPLLSFFIIAFFLLIKFLKKPSLFPAVSFAIVSGMLFSIRVLGVIVPFFAVVFFVLNLLNGNIQKTTIKFLITYLLLFLFFAILFYPVLWHAPVEGIEKAFSLFSHFNFDDPQLFLGRLIVPQQLPWYYIPVWMGITIPVVWQLFFVAGTVVLLLLMFKEVYFLFKSSWQLMLIAAWLFAPWLAVLILHSTVYDEWRHLFFIYPAFILIAVYGLQKAVSRGRVFKKWINVQALTIAVALIALQCFFTLKFMIANHPFENVYFNPLAGKNPEKKFDLDYWGLSYRQGLEYLVQQEQKDTIKVCWQNAPGNYNLVWLNDNDRKRIFNVPFDSTEYFITNFRFHPEQYQDTAWHLIRAGGISILAIEQKKK